ncbi:MAG: acyl-CoA thioesterase [Bacteroidales bacterium]|nr:MAG: acyl-CoA thioesterase [Bacteroidales bacterium]
MKDEPKGELTIQVLAMPKDTNPAGDIFGGWLISQMDIAGGIYAQKIAKGRIVTVAINSITFKLPVFNGDILSCYVDLVKRGRTSLTVHIEAYVNKRFELEKRIKVTEGDFTYVKVNDERVPVPL